MMILLLALMTVSCRREHGSGIIENSAPVSVRGGNIITIPAESDFHSIYIESEGEGWTCQNSSDWLTLSVSEGNGSCYLDFSSTTNRNQFARVTFIHICDKNDPDRYKVSVRVIQEAGEPNVQGTLTGDMNRQHRMGYGYNISKEYMNDSSFSSLPILNYYRIVDMEKVVGNIITENIRNNQEVEKFSGVTLTEITVKMTEKKADYTDFALFGKTSESTTELFSRKTSSQECGIVRLKRVVSSRTVDMGMLRTQNLSLTDTTHTMFDSRFCSALNEMMKSPKEKMRDFFNTYGTHLVVSADLGGVLELYTVIDRATSTETEKSVISVSSKLFGITVGKGNLETEGGESSEDVTYKADLKIYGGSQETQNIIKEKINGQGQISGVISEEEMNGWQNSLVLTPDIQSGQKYNAALVDCQVVPIYELITDPDISSMLEDLTYEYLGARKTSSRDEQTHGILSMDKVRENWADGNSAVQVIHSPNNASDMVGVACREYVPAIRADKSCTVIYPMVNGFPYLYCGLFTGDENHRPGCVRWVGNQCVYEPNDSVFRENPKFSSWFNSDGSLKNVYFYWSSVHAAPEKQKSQPVSFNVRFGSADVSAVNWESLSDIGWTDTHSSTKLVKVGPLFWSETSKPLKQTMAEWRFLNVIKHLEFNPGSGLKGYYSAISDVMTDDYLEDRFSYLVLNGLPTEVQARSLMYVINGRPELLNYGTDGRNGLGLVWPKGVISVPYKVEGETKTVDPDALLILVQEPSPLGEMYTGMKVVRLGQSGRAATYSLFQYCQTILDAGNFMFKYFPVFTATHYVQ